MRKRKNWDQPCPNKDCSDYGKVNNGNISSISTYKTKSGPRRIFKCKTCGETFSETRDTVFFDLKVPEEKVIMALKMFLVKVSLTNICFILETKEETLLMWLDRAAQKAEEINSFLLKDLPVTRVELDEMWTFIKKKTQKIEDDDSEYGKQWVWISYAPEFRLILGTVVGPRTYDSALQLITMTAAMVIGVPMFFSDGFSCYLQALIECYHQIKTFPKTGKKGRPKNPVKEPHPELVYGQLVKEKKGGRLVHISKRVICGAERLAKSGLSISTSLLERLNLTFRQSLAPLGRKTLSFSKDIKRIRQQVVFFQAFYNVARPHMSLREKICEPVNPFVIKWSPRTPAMAAGITEHVWTFRQLLVAKFPQAP